MKKMNTKIASGVLAVSMISAALAGCGKSLDGTQIAATINGQDVTLGMASFMVRDQQAQTSDFYAMMAASYGMQMPEALWSQKSEDGITEGENLKNGVMEQIKSMIVIKDHAGDYGVALTDEETAKIQEAAKAFMEANDEKALKELAVSQKDIETYLELATYQVNMREPMLADVDRTVTDEEADQTTVTYIRVSTEGTQTDEEGNVIELTEEEKAAKAELAQKVLDKINVDGAAEADLSAQAKEVDESLSAAVGSFTTAGDENDTLDQAVKDSVADLKDGDVVSKVVEGKDGYYVVRLDKKFDQDATDRKKDTIISDRETEAYEDLVEEWTGSAEIKINEDVWKTLKVTDEAPFQYKPQEPEAENTDVTETDVTETEEPEAEESETEATEAEESDAEGAEEQE